MSDVASLFKELEVRITGTTKDRRKSFNLLYRARGSVSADDFHLCCDGKGPTITLLHGKLNTLFGGYTSKNWSSDKKKVKSDSQAFLFYKNDHAEAICHFLPVKNTHQDRAITCDANFGPTFGGGPLAWNDYDLQTFVSDKKHKSESIDNYLHLNGNINIKHAYERETTRPISQDPRPTYSQTTRAVNEPSQETRTQDEQSEADINGGKLIVKSLEVYQVVDDHLPDPWRHKPKDEDVEEMKKKLENMEPLPGLGLEDYNILLIGIIGAGKSSFFNTLATVFAKDVKSHAIVGEEAECITNEVHAYKLATDTGKQLKLRFFDIRGFEDNRGYKHELDLLLEGRLPVGFTFPEQPTPLDPEELLENRRLKDEIHLVCFVVDATNLKVVSNELHKRIAAIKTVIRRKGVQMVSVATKFDYLCPKISEDADHVYNSPKAKASTKAVSTCFGIPLKHVFPIVNYVEETDTSTGKNRLAVQALTSMVQLMVDYLRQHKGMATKMDSWTERSHHLPVAKSEQEKNLQVLRITDLLSDFENCDLRVLCVGNTHSGKSSFIDAISSLLTGKISTRVNKGLIFDDGAPASTGSTTEKFEMYKLKYKNGAGELLTTKVSFGDLPGFQKEGGMTFDHAKKVVKGNVPNKYKIKQGITKDSNKYIAKPKTEDKIHCICYVFDVCTVDTLQESFVTEFKTFQTFLRQKGIPYVVILTKADKLSDAVKENCLQVFDNNVVKEIKDKLIKKFNFVESKIFPVINYIHQNRVVPEMDALLSDVFKEILDLGKEYLDDYNSENKDSSDGEDDDE